MAQAETYHPAFEDSAASKTAYTSTKGKLSTPDISYGLPYPQACAKHVNQTFRCSRVYIIVSGTMSRNHPDTLERLIEALGKDRVVGVRKGMQSHTLWSEILQIVAEAREARADCLVTLGAGSVTDGAKIVCLALANDVSKPGQLANYSVEAKAPATDVQLPKVTLICIPTSLSGGEYFSLAGGTDDSTHHKQAFMHAGMGAKLIILDPELCLLTPEFYWLSTGVRSLDHCVETLCSLEATATSDRDAENGLRILVPSLLKCKADPKDIEARHQCHMAVLLAMKSIRAGIPMGGSHAIGHQLGPMGVPHGITSCVMCPAVMKWNVAHGSKEPAIEKRQQKIREIFWSEADVAKVLKEAGLQEDRADLGDILDIIIRSLGLPRTLKEVGVKESDIDKLSNRALDDAWARTNPIPLTEASQVKEILMSVAG